MPNKLQKKAAKQEFTANNQPAVWEENDILHINQKNKIITFDKRTITFAKLKQNKKKSYGFYVILMHLLFFSSYMIYFSYVICLLHIFTYIFFYFYLTQYQFYFVILAENKWYELEVKPKDKEIFNDFLEDFSFQNHADVKLTKFGNHGGTFRKYIEIE
ncbi:hypothetical protein [Flavobacterium lacus]|uniref:Uncharacterized protein n=1 Tax=Flavobacterium lacus TaxID=1353778 RepID=A0A328WPP6_9FLAO|nr:hypothetical protein [Flavobacterium lacus]RAR47255.1 hypothetical protein B0I10_11048 [Flavobacterium lacus]